MENGEIVIEVQKRDVVGRKVKNLRLSGELPAIVYGKGMEAIPIRMDGKSTQRIIPQLGPSSLITLVVDGTSYPTLLRDRQINFITGELIHLDFMVVSLTETVRTEVPIHLDGEAPAVKELNGILVNNLESVEVEGLPTDLPSRIRVDISVLEEVGDTIFVKDLSLPATVTLLTDPDEAVVLITSQVIVEEEEEEEELLEEDLEAEPELIEKGKKDEFEEEE